MLRLGILGSTNGTDMQAIIDAIGQGKLNAKIKLVISNNQEAYILKRAQKNNIPNKYISDKNLDRHKFGALITKNFIELNVDIILLIGFMKILSDSFCLKWKDKILNVHPSLLPKYATRLPGARLIRKVVFSHILCSVICPIISMISYTIRVRCVKSKRVFSNVKPDSSPEHNAIHHPNTYHERHAVGHAVIGVCGRPRLCMSVCEFVHLCMCACVLECLQCMLAHVLCV